MAQNNPPEPLRPSASLPSASRSAVHLPLYFHKSSSDAAARGSPPPGTAPGETGTAKSAPGNTSYTARSQVRDTLHQDRTPLPCAPPAAPRLDTFSVIPTTLCCTLPVSPLR